MCVLNESDSLLEAPRNSSGIPNWASDSRIRRYKRHFSNWQILQSPSEERFSISYDLGGDPNQDSGFDSISEATARHEQHHRHLNDLIQRYSLGAVMTLKKSDLRARASLLAYNTLSFPISFWIRCILWSNICSYSSKKEIISASQKSIDPWHNPLLPLLMSALWSCLVFTQCALKSVGLFQKWQNKYIS